MQYILDTAHLESIRHAFEYYPIDGVTTNPTIISREHSDFGKLILDIRRLIGADKMFHIPVSYTHLWPEKKSRRRNKTRSCTRRTSLWMWPNTWSFMETKA